MRLGRCEPPEPQAARRHSAAADWVRALGRTANINLEGTRTLAIVVDEWAARDPSNAALTGEADSLTYEQLSRLANRCARWALAQGLKKGNRVALLMENEPAFAALWIGLTRVGVVVALLNTRLPDRALTQSIKTAAVRHVIVGASCNDAIPSLLAMDLQVWTYGSDMPRCERLDSHLAISSGAPLTEGETGTVTLRDPALLIYTSGTTGLPKAANVSHFRIMMWSEWFAGIMDARPEDRLYDCLPMYHSIGGVVAVGSMLAAGGTVIVRRGFAADRFWQDVSECGATIFQYIGELCRYLVALPENGSERSHHLRLCCGNGLRADVWTAFAERFAIPRILEFYAATEGSFSLFNLEGKPGAIGRIPPFMAHRSPVALVRFDAVTESPVRGVGGFCIPCQYGEPGEALGRMAINAADLASRLEGYTDADATERKILRDVFAPGDMWFRTGDLMVRDQQGFFAFVDRIGDTFRWKGENVSTTEVADMLLVCPGVIEAAVYGVMVPGMEGRAGMAALVVNDGFNVDALRDCCAARLPRYARPVFIRLLSAIAKTETFRAKKVALQREGFESSMITDPLFVLVGAAYLPLDADRFRQITAGDLRL